MVYEGIELFERSIALFEQLGDRRGLMSAIIARAYLPFAIDLHLTGAAKRIEEIRRLTTQMTSFTRESERAATEAQMMYGVQVFAHAKVVPDLALSRGADAHRQARLLGDRSLEFASASCIATTHLELDDMAEAERWLARAAEAAAAVPMPLRARQLEILRGRVRAAAGDAAGMRNHLERAVRLATEQGRPAARCEALAALALEAARLGAARSDDELLELAERSAKDAKDIVQVLPGHPPWGAAADAASPAWRSRAATPPLRPRRPGRRWRRCGRRIPRTSTCRSSCRPRARSLPGAPRRSARRSSTRCGSRRR